MTGCQQKTGKPLSGRRVIIYDKHNFFLVHERKINYGTEGYNNILVVYAGCGICDVRYEIRDTGYEIRDA